MNKTFIGLGLVLILTCSSLAQDNKQIVLEAIKAIDAGSSTREANQAKQTALKYLIETEDIQLIVCGQVFSLFSDKKNKNAPDMTMAYTIGMGAYKISNPAADENAAQNAGLILALRAYELAVVERPKTKFEKVEDLLKKRNSGELATLVGGFNCGKK
jgi:hypothetical protein